jgi:hypothetical protein
MGRLANPGLGDILDRLSILALKIVHGEDRGRDISPFVAERAALLRQLVDDPNSLPNIGTALSTALFFAQMELGAVNAALWQAEDQLRAWRGPSAPPSPEELAVRIQALNDRRAALIDDLNDVSGRLIAAEKKL